MANGEYYYRGKQVQLVLRLVLTLATILLSVTALVGLVATIPGVGDTFLPRSVVLLDFATVWYLPSTPAFLTGFLSFYYANAFGAQALLLYYVIAALFAVFQAVSAWYSAFSPAHSSGFAADVFNVVVASVGGAVALIVVVLAWVILARQQQEGDLRAIAGSPPTEEDDRNEVEMTPLRGRTRF